MSFYTYVKFPKVPKNGIEEAFFEVFLKLAGSAQMNASVEGEASDLQLCGLCRQREATLVTLYTTHAPPFLRASANGIWKRKLPNLETS